MRIRAIRGKELSSSVCVYRNMQPGEPELTEERKRHIAENHPDLLPEHWERIADTLADPDQIRRSTRFSNARLFTRWFDTYCQKAGGR